MGAIRELWRGGEAPQERYARSILTAGAAARIAPSADLAERCRRPHRLDAERGHGPRGGALGARSSSRRGAGNRAWALLARRRAARRASSDRARRVRRPPTTAPAASARNCWPRRSPGSAGSTPTRRRRAGFRLGGGRPLDRGDRRGGAGAGAGRGRPARRRRHADRDLARRPAGLSVPDRPRAARGRHGLSRRG